ncbi:histidine-phosphotransfer domain, HPT domain-containing protein [Auriculariales sp. MPI-PUGE-AT-0066]|nr:histidine-phosphotransfer domain, HPT domain-containing protein [Auriculariales sp. MPI-PUGE-AT-0066]
MAPATPSSSNLSPSAKSAKSGSDPSTQPGSSTTGRDASSLDTKPAVRHKSPPPPPSSTSSILAPAAKPITPSKSGESSRQTPAATEANDEPPVPKDIINMDIFDQILELEDGDNYEFSVGMTQQYLDQAESTFKDMDAAFDKKDLKQLKDLGHFLKGSSSALGISKVQHSCEIIYNYGKCRNATNTKDITEDVALNRVAPVILRVKAEFREANEYLRDWFQQQGANF